MITRIRMGELVWRYIAETPHQSGLVDPLQKRIARLIQSNPHAHERILVTDDDDLVDLLRDWCAAMMVANYESGAPILAEAAHVVDLLDRADERRLEAR